MAKSAKQEKNASSWRVNIEIAPGNMSRLRDYIEVFKNDPNRSRPAINITDALNEALDWFFNSAETESIGSTEATTESTKKQRKNTKKR